MEPTTATISFGDNYVLRLLPTHIAQVGIGAFMAKCAASDMMTYGSKSKNDLLPRTGYEILACVTCEVDPQCICLHCWATSHSLIEEGETM